MKGRCEFTCAIENEFEPYHPKSLNSIYNNPTLPNQVVLNYLQSSVQMSLTSWIKDTF